MEDKNIDKDKEIVEQLINGGSWSEYITTNQSKAIENVLSELEKKDKDNNDLRRLYRRTSEKLIENGKEELADYFLAQINEAPTFAVDDIDYYTEYYKQQKDLETYKKIAEKLAEQWFSMADILILNGNHIHSAIEIIDWAKNEVLKDEKK